MIDKTNMIKPDLYMKDNTIYFVVPDETKPIKMKYPGRENAKHSSRLPAWRTRTLADDILDSVFKTKLEELLV